MATVVIWHRRLRVLDTLWLFAVGVEWCTDRSQDKTTERSETREGPCFGVEGLSAWGGYDTDHRRKDTYLTARECTCRIIAVTVVVTPQNTSVVDIRDNLLTWMQVRLTLMTVGHQRVVTTWRSGGCVTR